MLVCAGSLCRARVTIPCQTCVTVNVCFVQVYSQAGRRVLPSLMLGSPAVILLWGHPGDSAKPQRAPPGACLLLAVLRNGELMVWDLRSLKQELKCSLAPLLPPKQGLCSLLVKPKPPECPRKDRDSYSFDRRVIPLRSYSHPIMYSTSVLLTVVLTAIFQYSFTTVWCWTVILQYTFPVLYCDLAVLLHRYVVLDSHLTVHFRCPIL